jgi:hypothetical protein
MIARASAAFVADRTDRMLDRQRHKIENRLGRIRDRRRA